MTKLAISAKRDAANAQTHFTFKFPDNSSKEYVLPDNSPLLLNFAAHGVNKKVRDLLGGAKEVDKQKELLGKLLESFAKNDWNATRNGDGKPAISILARALVQVTGKTLDEAVAYVKTLSRKQQSVARRDPRIAPVILALQKSDAKEANADGDVLEGFIGTDAPVEGAETEAEVETA